MMKTYPKYHLLAQQRWPKARCIAGNARYVVLTACDGHTAAMFEEYSDAVDALNEIREIGCSPSCIKAHTIVDLDTE